MAKTDLRRLADHFVAVFAQKHRREVKGLSARAWRRLFEHTWPGNIRELENCIESAMVVCERSVIDEPDLPLPTRAARSARALPIRGHDLSRTLAEVERDYVRAVVEDCGGNQSEAARRLQVSRNTLARKLRL